MLRKKATSFPFLVCSVSYFLVWGGGGGGGDGRKNYRTLLKNKTSGIPIHIQYLKKVLFSGGASPIGNYREYNRVFLATSTLIFPIVRTIFKRRR